MTPRSKKWLVLITSVALTVAAGEEPGRYQIGSESQFLCFIGPCPNRMITDRKTGEVLHVALKWDISGSSPENLAADVVSGPAEGLLVDGEVYADASTNGRSVLRIMKIVGRVTAK